MSDSFAWVCICILDGDHFSFPDAYANPRTTKLALIQRKKVVVKLWKPNPT